MAAAKKVVVARENFCAATKDGEVFVNAGDAYASTHALVKKFPELFGPASPEPKA